MKDLIIKRTKNIFFSPEINFNASTGICEMSGESYPEHTFDFYNKILDWLNEFIEKGGMSIEFNIKITYFNTSSSRAILDILILLKDTEIAGKNVTINWYYDPDNKFAMKQEVDDFEDEADIKINFTSLEES